MMKSMLLIAVAALFTLLAGCGVERDKSFTNFAATDHPYFGHPSADKHADWLKANHFDIRQCTACHGSNLTGGSSGVSCASCHQAVSVTSCNFCHGNDAGVATDPTNWAPPRALNGDTARTIRSVGRHQFHMTQSGFFGGLPLTCNGCHTVPARWDSPTHMNGVVDMAANVGYDREALTCNSCHGASGYGWIRP